MLTRRRLLALLAGMPALHLLHSRNAHAFEALLRELNRTGALDGAPSAIIKPMNASRILSPVWYWNGRGARYQRFQNLIVWRRDGIDIEFRVQDLSRGGGGRILPFAGETYTVTVDGEPVARFQSREAEDHIGTVHIDASGLDEGWHVLDVSTPVEEMSVPYPVYVLRGDKALAQQWMPVLTLSYQANRQAYCRLMWVPARYAPRHVPVARREYRRFDDAPSPEALWFERLIPTSGYNRRTNRNREGVHSTFNTMWYNWSGMMRRLPQNPLLDGPRGIGTIGSIMHVEIGIATQTADPASRPRDNLYVLDPWRVCRVSPEGDITTLAGWRHRLLPTYWEDEPELELVGDWTAVPAERHGFHELWGMAWDDETLEVDTDAAPIPEQSNRQPHLMEPVMFVSDSQNNRVCRLAFNPRSDTVAPRVTEFLTGLEDPWDVVYWERSLIVSERQRHRIVQYDVVSGALQRVIAEGRPLASVRRNRRVRRQADLEEIRREDCVAPEGLYIMDDWLYFGSIAMNQVKRVHLRNGDLEVVWNNAASRRDTYIKIAVSDGTFGPRHTVFLTDWSMRRRGFPDVRLPDGRNWNLPGNPRNSLPRGLGGAIEALGYSGAAGVRNGRLVCGSIQEGLVDVSLAGPGDQAFDRALYLEGRRRWNHDDLSFFYGDGGYGYYGLELPWGYSPETDYYLEVCGQKRP